MSEAEKVKRSLYKQNRKKWILIQASAILLVALAALSMFVVYSNLNKTYYVSYTDEGNADYNVSLKENDFFQSSTITDGKGYISELISKVNTSFRYEMNIAAQNVRYEYTSYVDATLEITDNYTKKVLYSPSFTLVDKSVKKSTNSMYISEIVPVDYDLYNRMAADFIEAYGLENVESKLIVTMHADISGTGDDFVGTARNGYSSSVIIPLCKKTISIDMSASVPNSEVKLLPCRRDVNPTVFSVLGFVFAVLSALLSGALVGFIYITRNDDINYEIKVKRLLNSYRSYIQIITNEFDSEGYQILTLGTFNEMLGIRDTIQSPILMNENEDKTRALFFIPTNTKLLYVYEIKVDDYDEIYAEKENEPELAEELIIIEDPVIIEEVDEAELEDALDTPDVELDTIDYIEDDDVEVDEGIEVIGVVWPEHENKNKVYKYDPNGETVDEGDIVLVPSHDKTRHKDIIRKATVSHGNHKVDPETIHFPLKKIIGVVKRGIRSQLEK